MKTIIPILLIAFSISSSDPMRTFFTPSKSVDTTKEKSDSTKKDQCENNWVWGPGFCRQLRDSIYNSNAFFLSNTGFRANTDAVALQTDLMAVNFFGIRLSLGANMSVFSSDSSSDTANDARTQFLLRRYITDGSNINGEIYLPIFAGTKVDYRTKGIARSNFSLIWGASLKGGIDISSLNSESDINSQNSVFTASLPVRLSIGNDTASFSFFFKPAYLIFSRHALKDLGINDPNKSLKGNAVWVGLIGVQSQWKQQLSIIADVGLAEEQIHRQLKARISLAYSH